jgi:hypothetical protein
MPNPTGRLRAGAAQEPQKNAIFPHQGPTFFVESAPQRDLFLSRSEPLLKSMPEHLIVSQSEWQARRQPAAHGASWDREWAIRYAHGIPGAIATRRASARVVLHDDTNSSCGHRQRAVC